MTSFSFGFSGDNYEEEDSHPAEDVAMDDYPSTANAIKPEIHRIEDLVGSSLLLPSIKLVRILSDTLYDSLAPHHALLAKQVIVKTGAATP